MTKYPKMQTLWKRKKIGNRIGSIIDGDFSRDEFKEIKFWEVTEKIDGMNTRVKFDENRIEFGGRTENADTHEQLYAELKSIFTLDKMQSVFGTDAQDVTIFGEGYGPGIEGGGAYSKTHKFIIFDVKVGEWWLLRESVDDIATKLGAARVPYIGYMSMNNIIEYVKTNPPSLISNDKQMEGVVCRTRTGLMFRNGDPLMWKLKCKDYK